MSTTLTEVSEYGSTVTVPTTGDARTPSSVNGAFQTLANRTFWLKDNVTGIASQPVWTHVGTDPTVEAQEITDNDWVNITTLEALLGTDQLPLADKQYIVDVCATVTAAAATAAGHLRAVWVRDSVTTEFTGSRRIIPYGSPVFPYCVLGMVTLPDELTATVKIQAKVDTSGTLSIKGGCFISVRVFMGDDSV